MESHSWTARRHNEAASSHPSPRFQRQWHRHRHRPRFEIPIAVDCAPRVLSSETFVRLTARETLHGSRQAAFYYPFSEPDRPDAAPIETIATF